MIRRVELDRVLAAVRASGVARDLERTLRPTGTGRPRQLQADVFVAGVILTILDGRNPILTEVHRTLTVEIARSAQVAIGTTYRRPGELVGRPITLRQVRYVLERIDLRLRNSTASASDLDDVERADRAEAFQRVVDKVVASSIPDHLPAPTAMALDATALESWGIGRRRHAAPEAPADPDERDAEPDQAEPGVRSFDPDARWGYRTKTYDNRTSYCFGYDLFALVAVPLASADPLSMPKLTHRLVVRPSGLDVVEPAITMLDDLARSGTPVSELLNDRAWSYKTADRWADPLRERGISQIFDLHPNDRGVRDHEGIRMVDGAPHCPSMPDELINIERPATLSPGELKKNANAADRAAYEARVAQIERFNAAIAERRKWAFRRVTSADATGAERWQCPAQAGKLMCEHCPMSQFLPEDTTRVVDPPAAATRPRACRQSTITLPGHVCAKQRQHLYWGSPEWIASHNRRAHVEGFFGNYKSTSGSKVTRGWCRVVGLIKTTFLAACEAAATNIRLLRSWSKKTGDITDPLCAPLPEDFGFEELTGHEAERANGPPR
jgi:hypothetical protein